MSVISGRKEIREYIKEAQRQGWVVMKTKSNHLKWISPENGFVISAGTPSDKNRFFQNLIKELTKKGYVVSSKSKKNV